jgi:site-specific recombinase XerD
MNTPTDSFPALVQRFFGSIRSEQEVSQHTVAAYRDTFRLLLRFIAERTRSSIDRITLEDFGPDTILSFLEHLEKQRRNLTRTRNARLTAIRAFVRFALGYANPEFLGQAHRILAIPSKRTNKPVLGFLKRKEVESVLAVIDTSTWTGQRDHLLFSLLYNTGARISEALQVKPADIQHRVVRLHGKGRKERDIPLWLQTHRKLLQWCRDNHLKAEQPVFANRDGRPLSRRSAARRLTLALTKAEKACPSLRGRKISPHTFRHSCAMHMLQAGVPLEIISLYLGHERPITTHGYIEADISMKKEALDHLQPLQWRRAAKQSSSHILAFLEAL